MNISNSILFFSAASFLFYGISCLFLPHMKNEFIRFGLENKRILTGILQILGSLGLLFGYFYSPILVIISAAGLALLMILGFGVRIKIKDPIVASSPALFYAILNTYLAFRYVSL